MTLVAMGIIAQSQSFLAQIDVVNDAIETAGSAAKLGLQGFTILCLLVLGFYMWRKDVEQKAERKERNEELKGQFVAILSHHESFAAGAKEDREKHNKQLLEVATQSALAMQAMAAATDGVKEWLKEHSWKPGRVREPNES